MAVASAELNRANKDPIQTPYLLLLEFWIRDDEASKIRLVVNNEDVTSNSEIYSKAYIETSMPDGNNGISTVGISVSNVDRVVGWHVLNLKRPLICRVMTINAADPDTIIQDTKDVFMVYNPTIDAFKVSGELLPILRSGEPLYGGVEDRFFPGL